MLTLEQRLPAQQIDRTVLGGLHQPCAGVVGDARLWPLLQRRHECVLREIFGHADVADDTGETSDDLRRLDAPHRVDGLMGVGHELPS
jgi:hypothetical protein